MEDACGEESKGEENPPLPPPSVSPHLPTTPGLLPGSNARNSGHMLRKWFSPGFPPSTLKIICLFDFWK